MKLKEGDIVEFRKTPKGKLYRGYIVGFFNEMYYIKHILKKQFYLVEPKEVILSTNLINRRNK
jgi:phage-related protein